MRRTVMLPFLHCAIWLQIRTPYSSFFISAFTHSLLGAYCVKHYRCAECVSNPGGECVLLQFSFSIECQLPVGRQTSVMTQALRLLLLMSGSLAVQNVLPQNEGTASRLLFTLRALIIISHRASFSSRCDPAARLTQRRCGRRRRCRHFARRYGTRGRSAGGGRESARRIGTYTSHHRAALLVVLCFRLSVHFQIVRSCILYVVFVVIGVSLTHTRAHAHTDATAEGAECGEARRAAATLSAVAALYRRLGTPPTAAGQRGSPNGALD